MLGVAVLDANDIGCNDCNRCRRLSMTNELFVLGIPSRSYAQSTQKVYSRRHQPNIRSLPPQKKQIVQSIHLQGCLCYLKAGCYSFRAANRLIMVVIAARVLGAAPVADVSLDALVLPCHNCRCRCCGYPHCCCRCCGYPHCCCSSSLEADRNLGQSNNEWPLPKGTFALRDSDRKICAYVCINLPPRKATEQKASSGCSEQVLAAVMNRLMQNMM